MRSKEICFLTVDSTISEYGGNETKVDIVHCLWNWYMWLICNWILYYLQLELKYAAETNSFVPPHEYAAETYCMRYIPDLLIAPKFVEIGIKFVQPKCMILEIWSRRLLYQISNILIIFCIRNIEPGDLQEMKYFSCHRTTKSL